MPTNDSLVVVQPDRLESIYTECIYKRKCWTIYYGRDASTSVHRSRKTSGDQPDAYAKVLAKLNRPKTPAELDGVKEKPFSRLPWYRR
ncbi:unnamed protein product [Hermetia illucens]|uniref:Uncharacterized protein n=1 Tax=Hermetia illucens TaxID=343691 RepID=A0A7R8UZT6_HERIL|nr:unnamed protein product [Hermetia illucens]